MKKLTPILTVDAIEPSLPFWIDALGFAKTTEGPHEGALGFAILEKDGYEVMLQSVASMQADVPGTVPPPGGSILFLEIEDLSATETAVAGFELLVPRGSPEATWSASRSSARAKADERERPGGPGRRAPGLVGLPPGAARFAFPCEPQPL